MIPNGKTDGEKCNGTVSHLKEHKMIRAISRGPYLHESGKQTTSSFQNGGGHETEASVSFENSQSCNSSPDGKQQQTRWNEIHQMDDNGDLSFEQMWELRRILDKRVKNKLSEGLSPEGQKAMELARAEVELSNRRGKYATNSKDNTNNKLPELELSNGRKKSKVKKRISFVDAYESSSASRLSGDIVDENSSEGTPKRWALGGGNVNVAMETVEIVSYGDTMTDSDADDIAIEETAKLNSVEKCLVWMGVHTDEDYDEQR